MRYIGWFVRLFQSVEHQVTDKCEAPSSGTALRDVERTWGKQESVGEVPTAPSTRGVTLRETWFSAREENSI